MNLQRLHTCVNENFHLIKDKIDLILDQTIERSKVRSINSTRLVSAFNKALKPNHIKVFTQIDDEAENDHPLMGAFCYEPDSPGKTAKIEITIFTASKRFEFSPENWEFFRYRFFEVLLHEFVHRAQYSIGRGHQTSLRFRVSPDPDESDDKKTKALIQEQRYIGEIDEIEAYARDCVEYWHYTKQGMPLTIRSLKKEFAYETTIHSLQYYFFEKLVELPAIYC